MFNRDNLYADNLQLLDKPSVTPLSFWLSNNSKFKFNCSDYIFVQRADRNKRINNFDIPGSSTVFDMPAKQILTLPCSKVECSVSIEVPTKI